MRRALSVPVIVLTILLFTASAVHAKPNEGIICNHVVQSGETIYCIARAYGVDPGAIAAQNGILNPGLIYPGQVLAIPDVYVVLPAGPTCAAQCPVPGGPCTCASYHTIVSGENLYRISLHYGVSMWRVAECNSIFNLNYILAGDVLCIPAP